MENDGVLLERVMQKLKDHPKLDTTHMHVSVTEGVVLLKGRADTDEEKLLAATLAASCPGITSVKDELTVGTGLIYTITNLISGLAANNDEELHKPKE